MIVSCLHNNFSGGIGDFFRGSIHLCEYASMLGIEFKLNFKNHPIGKYVQTDYHEYADDIVDLEIYKQENKFWGDNKDWIGSLKTALNYLLSEYDNHINISSFYHQILETDCTYLMNHLNEYQLADHIAKYFASSIKYNDEVIEYAHQLLEKIGYNDYNIVHFRLGDLNSWPKQFESVNIPDKHQKNINFRKFEHNFQKYLNYCLGLNLNELLLLSDNNNFKKYVSHKNLQHLKTTHLNSVHSAVKPGLLIHEDKQLSRNDDDLFYVAVDMYLLSMAKNVVCFSVYDWGSGFPYWVSKIYSTPIKFYKITAKYEI